MPYRSSSSRPKHADLNQLAASIIGEATYERLRQAESEKDPLAVELGRRGGLKGGEARAAKLTPEQRREIAKKAAKARWGQHHSL